METLWIDFVNSDWHDHLGRTPPEDRLDRDDWVRKFADRWDLPLPAPLETADRETLRSLRDSLRRVVRSVARGEEPARADLAVVDGALGAVGVVCCLEQCGSSFRVALDPADGGIGAVVFRIATSFTDFLVKGERARLKVCENPDCHWVFYDETRSRTRRWCADGCGNLMKVRRFRERRRDPE